MINFLAKRLKTDRVFRHRMIHGALDHAIFLLTVSAVCGGMLVIFSVFQRDTLTLQWR